MIQPEGISFLLCIPGGTRERGIYLHTPAARSAACINPSKLRSSRLRATQLQSYKIYRLGSSTRKWIRENMNKKGNRKSRRAKRTSFLVVLETTNGTHQTRDVENV
jgi:hypothetical protein